MGALRSGLAELRDAQEYPSSTIIVVPTERTRVFVSASNGETGRVACTTTTSISRHHLNHGFSTSLTMSHDAVSELGTISKGFKTVFRWLRHAAGVTVLLGPSCRVDADANTNGTVSSKSYTSALWVRKSLLTRIGPCHDHASASHDILYALLISSILFRTKCLGVRMSKPDVHFIPPNYVWSDETRQ